MVLRCDLLRAVRRHILHGYHLLRSRLNPDGTATEANAGGEWHAPGGGISIQSYNTLNGYIAKWTDINAGPDGAFTLHYAFAANTPGSDIPTGASQNAAGNAYGPSGIALIAVPEPTFVGILGAAGLLLVRRRRA